MDYVYEIDFFFWKDIYVIVFVGDEWYMVKIVDNWYVLEGEFGKFLVLLSGVFDVELILLVLGELFDLVLCVVY